MWFFLLFVVVALPQCSAEDTEGVAEPKARVSSVGVDRLQTALGAPVRQGRVGDACEDLELRVGERHVELRPQPDPALATALLVFLLEELGLQRQNVEVGAHPLQSSHNP